MKIFRLSILLLQVSLMISCGEKEKTREAPPTASPPAKEIAYKKLDYVEHGGVGIYTDPETGKPFDGIARDWHDKDKTKLRLEYPFKSGKLHGVAREWYPDGKKLAETTWVDGQRTGKNTEWNKDGTLFRERVYDRDKIVSEKNYPTAK
jgi:antitoxin component YwqK of YwqJK toxin-antitoxin module